MMLGRPTDLQRRVALAFVAHPDDAEMTCAGTLIRLAEAAREIHIATVTAGDCGGVSEAAEVFVQHKRHPYPTDDLLADLFSLPAAKA